MARKPRPETATAFPTPYPQLNYLQPYLRVASRPAAAAPNDPVHKVAEVVYPLQLMPQGWSGLLHVATALRHAAVASRLGVSG